MTKPLEPPYVYIRGELHQGQVIPFLGAGASFGARNPAKEPWRTPKPANPQDFDVAYLPTAGELADHLAEVSQFPPEESRELTKVAQYFDKVAIGRKGLDTALHQIFAFAQQPGPIHDYLASLAKDHKPLLVVTTNYDDLIERAFDAAGAVYDTVVHQTEESETGKILWRPHGAAPQAILPKDLDIDLAVHSVVYKIHGAVDRAASAGQYVITEDDYVDFLTRMTQSTAIPRIFAEPFQQRPFLFVGYGLYDWNLRVVLNRIHKELRRPGEIKSWAIEAQSKPLEKALWGVRNVTVYDDLAIEELVRRLRGPAPPAGPRPAFGASSPPADEEGGGR